MDSPTSLSPQPKPLLTSINPTTAATSPSPKTKSSRQPKPKSKKPQSNTSPDQSPPKPRRNCNRNRRAPAATTESVSSPRNARKTRKRSDKEIVLADIAEEDGVATRPRKRRQENKHHQQELDLVAYDPSPCSAALSM